MKYKYILFDLDGTLTDPYEGITRCFKYALEHFGIEARQEDLTPVIGPPLIDSFRDMFGFDTETGWMAVNKYRERYETIGWRENRLLDGVDPMLKGLKEDGRRIALATSKPYVFAKKIIEEYGISEYFDAVVGAELDGRRGTKAEVIDRAVEELGSPDKSRIIMVGDRKNDVEGAAACGITCLGVRVGYAEPGELEAAGADYIADTVDDMYKFLLNN